MKEYFRTFIPVFFLLALTGCETMTFLDPSSPAPAYPKLTVELPYQDFSGVFHVHSKYSHDSKGTFEEIARAARKAHEDFVMITDHNTLQGVEEKKEGFYGDVLVIIGDEISTSAGHLSVFDIKEQPDRNRSAEEVVRGVAEQGGLSFVAHGVGRKKPWSDWSLQPITGMEIYNLSNDIYDDGKLRGGLKVLFFPPRAFFRSVLDNLSGYLERWDLQLKEGKCVGVGAVDAHQKVRIFGLAVDDYDTMFKVVQTHAWAKDLSREAILDAFQKGHLYVSFDIVHPAREFMFLAETPSGKVIMGDSVKDSGELLFKVFLPEAADTRLLKDGKVWKRTKEASFETRSDGPGIYRVEAYWKKKLWIVSNPIYVEK